MSYSCESEELQEFAVHLLVLSHAYVVPNLKKLCQQQLEKGLINVENVTDILQVALLCDAPRLSLVCHRMIMKNYKVVTLTDGWNAMKQSHPMLEKQIFRSLIDEERVSYLNPFFNRTDIKLLNNACSNLGILIISSAKMID